MRVLLVCLTASLACAPAAWAAVAGSDPDGLAIVDDVGERNRLVVREAQGGGLSVRDTVALRATPGCTARTAFELLCSSPFSSDPRRLGGRVLVGAGAGDDHVDVRGTTCCLSDDFVVRGGPGDDTLLAAEEILHGGSGDDRLRGGSPQSRCGTGRDVLLPSRLDLVPSVAADCERIQIAPGLTFGVRPAVEPARVVLQARLTGARVRGRLSVSAGRTRIAAGRVALSGDGRRVVVLRRTARREIGRGEDLRVVLTPSGSRPRGYRLPG